MSQFLLVELSISAMSYLPLLRRFIFNLIQIPKLSKYNHSLNNMKNKLLIASLAIAFLTIANLVFGAIGSGGITPGTFWKISGVNLLPVTNTWQIGSSAVRVAKGWFTDLDVSGTFTLGGVVGTGGMDLNGEQLKLDPDGGMYLQAAVNDYLGIMGGNVGIGTTGPETMLNIWKATAGSVSPIANTLLTIENDTQAYISLLAPDTQDTGIVFGGPTGNARGMIRYYNNISALPDTMVFVAGNSTALQLSYPSGILAAFQAATTISTPVNTNLTLSNTGTGNIILSPGGNVGIGNTTPLATLDVTGSASLSANLSLRGNATAHTFD